MGIGQALRIFIILALIISTAMGEYNFFSVTVLVILFYQEMSFRRDNRNLEKLVNDIIKKKEDQKIIKKKSS